MLLKALKSFPYQARTIAVGETFDAEPEHAAMMVKAGAAETAEEDKPKKRTYTRRNLTAEE